MNVYELQERILELSHDEVTHDTNLRTRSLRWLNSAYHEIMEVMMPLLADTLNEDETLDVVDGVVTFSKLAQKVLRVENADTGAVIVHKVPESISVNEQSLSFRLMATGIVISGKNIPTKVRVVYVPQIMDLEEDDTEEQILIPSQYHAALVWGALVWASIFERGFTSQRELSLYQMKWEESKRNAKLSLMNRSVSRFKVDEFNLV